jgi:hypothetical protein
MLRFHLDGPKIVTPLCDPAFGVCPTRQPTASYDPRMFEFALKVNL